MNLIEKAKQLAHGFSTLSIWTINGNVVEPEKAQERADICTGRLNGKRCPQNQDGLELIESTSTMFRRIVEFKNKLKLRVRGEKNLHTCIACACPLRTKVWLEPNMTAPGDQRHKFPAFCWVLKEHPECSS